MGTRQTLLSSGLQCHSLAVWGWFTGVGPSRVSEGWLGLHSQQDLVLSMSVFSTAHLLDSVLASPVAGDELISLSEPQTIFERRII